MSSSVVSDTEVWCGSGVACAKLAKQCIKWGLGPAEFFAGIPGTLGGALAMNAGAFGGETWRHVLGVATIDRAGVRHERPASDYVVELSPRRAARRTNGSSARVCSFEQRPGVSNEDIRLLLARRKATQPIGEWSCGSVFTNPPGDHAARLIDSAGLKGHRIGGARVSEMHANFIVNDGTRERRGHRAADRARDERRCERRARRAAQARGAHRGRERRMSIAAPTDPRDFGRVAVLHGRDVVRARGVARFRPQLSRGAAAPRRRCASGRRHSRAARRHRSAKRCDRVFNILHGMRRRRGRRRAGTARRVATCRTRARTCSAPR